MDVLGLLSNISQVIDLLVKIGVMCSLYCVDVKRAPQDVRKLLKEVDRLTAVIKELELMLQSPKGSSKIESSSLRQAVFDLRRLLAELVAKLDLGAKNVRAIWPFKKREIHDIFAAIERQKANILLHINIEQTAILLDVHQEIVLSKLRVADGATYDSSIDGEESFCLQGTRNHIIEQIQKWSASPDAQSIFWLNGMAGTGKSTISRTIAQLFANESILGASFFFKRGEGDRGRTSFLITTIAAQLVRRIPSLAPRIREVLDGEPQIHEKPLSDQFQKLILDPLEKNPGCWSPNLLIVIDALDECGHEESMRTLVSILSKAKQRNNPRLKIFLTSRPELPIRLGFQEISGKYDNLLLAAVSSTTIEHDIELFMRHQLHTIKSDYNKSVTEHRKISPDWPGDDIVQKLVISAVPLFIVAATICRFLRDRRLGGPHHQLRKILEYQQIETSGLDMTYLPTLDSLSVGLSLSARQEVLTRFRYLVGSIITLAQPLSIRSLARLLDVTTDAVEDQLDLLHSVLGVPIDLDTPVRLLHLSFRDFLVDPEKKLDPIKYPFWVDEQIAHSKLFSQCIKLLSADGVLREDICSVQLPGTLLSDIDHKVIDEHLPTEVQYACMFWTHHWNLSNQAMCDGDITHRFLERYLLNWLEALSLMGRSADSVSMIDELLDKLGGANTQAITSLLRDARRFILANLGTFNKAPLQIYSSALVFTPETSIVRKLFEKCIPIWLSSIPTVQSHWDPCLATIDNQVISTSKIITFPTGNRCVSISPHNTLNIWDTKSMSRIATYEGHLGTSVRFSSDGREIEYLSGHKVLHIMNTATKDPIASFIGHSDKIIRAVLSADGSQLASASQDGVLNIWDRETQKCLATYDHNSETDRIVGFSPDGLTFLIISDRNTIQLLHTRRTCLKLVIRDHKQTVHATAFSPNSLALVSIDNNDTLIFTDIVSGNRLIAKGANSATKADLVFFSNSNRLISPMLGHALGIWNVTTARCESLLQGHRSTVSDIILSKDESRIVSSSYDKTIKIWDASTCACITTYIGHDSQVISIALSADEKLLISADDAGNCKVWDIAIKTSYATDENDESALLEVAFSPDMKKIATTSGNRIVKLWNATDGKCAGTSGDHQLFAWAPLMIPQDMLSAPFDYMLQHRGLFGCPRSVTFSPDGSKLMTTSSSDEGADLRLWNTTTGQYELLLRGAESPFRSMAISADGTKLSATSRDGTLMYWDTQSQKLLGSFDGETYGVSSSIHSPDGANIFLACDDGIVRLFQPSTRISEEVGDSLGQPALLVAVSADGSKLASSSRSILKIWNIDTKTCMASSKAAPFEFTYMLSQLQFSPDNQHLVILHEGGEAKVEILNAETGQCIKQLRICGLGNRMEFDPLGSSLITNVGTFAFDPPSQSHKRAATLSDFRLSSSNCIREPKMIGIGLSSNGEWVTWNSQKLLWLQPTYRASASDIVASTIALGTRRGRLLLIGIDPSAVPNSN